MNTSQLLSEITRLYVSPSERGSALATLLKNIQDFNLSRCQDKLESCRSTIGSLIQNSNLLNPEKELLANILNLAEYYLDNSQAASAIPTQQELPLYENIYHSFGKFLMYSTGRQYLTEPTPTDIRIFLVLSGLSRKAIYPEHILKFHRSSSSN